MTMTMHMARIYRCLVLFFLLHARNAHTQELFSLVQITTANDLCQKASLALHNSSLWTAFGIAYNGS